MPGSLSKLLAILAFSGIGFRSWSQQVEVQADLSLLGKALSVSQEDSGRRSYLYKGEKSFIKKYNPVSLALGGAMAFYQHVLSRHLSASCLYLHSCSEFSKDAIRQYGLPKGILLTLDRLNRCNIIAAQDLRRYQPDPVTGRYPDPALRYRLAKHRDN